MAEKGTDWWPDGKGGYIWAPMAIPTTDNNIIQTIERLHDQWNIHISVLPQAVVGRAIQTILLIGKDDYGDHPAILIGFQPLSAKLYINGTGFTYFAEDDAKIGKWMDIEISQHLNYDHYQTIIRVNNVEVDSVRHNYGIEYSDIRVFSGRRRNSGHVTASGLIKDVKITTFKSDAGSCSINGKDCMCTAGYAWKENGYLHTCGT